MGTTQYDETLRTGFVESEEWFYERFTNPERGTD
jgi:hypothetical protein